MRIVHLLDDEQISTGIWVAPSSVQAVKIPPGRGHVRILLYLTGGHVVEVQGNFADPHTIIEQIWQTPGDVYRSPAP